MALIRLLLATVLLAGATATAAEDDLAALLRRLQSELREDRLAEALTTARQAAALQAPQAALWYNLAGLEEQLGEPDRAVAAFAHAVDLGFDDFRHADRDEDLAGLRDRPAYQEARARWAADLAVRAPERTLRLEVGAWSAPFALPDRRGGDDPPAATVRLRPGAGGLECELLIAGHEVTPTAPWQGGSGVLVALTLLEAGDAADGSHHAEFAFGMTDGLPSGAVRLQERWQRVAELTPKLKLDHATGRLQLTFAIPWSLCGNLHPLVDETLGLNMVYLRRGGEQPHGRAAWLDDPAVGRADRAWRRGVPIRWDWPPPSGPLVHGRPADTIVRDGGIELRPLALVAPGERTARVQLVLRDRDGRIAHRETWTLDGAAGLRRRDGRLPGELPAGSVRLGASYHDPQSGTTVVWETDLVVLPDGWEADAAARIAVLPARERPSLEHRLAAIEAELAARHPLAGPAALGATVDEVEDLLARFARTGTTLPAGGTYLAVLPGRDGRPPLRCSLALPEGWRRGDEVRALLLLARTSGGEQQAVTLAPRLVAEIAAAGGGPAPAIALAIPHLGELGDGDPDVAAIAAWLREFLDCGPLHLAGVDLLAASVIELAGQRPADVAGILMLTGMNFTPYPGEDQAALAARVSGLDPGLAAGWLWFPEEQTGGDQATALRRGLRAAGLRLDPSRPIPGGLDLGQAWQRALAWTMQLTP